MKWAKVVGAVALVWGNSAFASLPSSSNVTGGDAQARISVLMEHFAHRHSDLNVHIRKSHASYPYDNAVADEVLSELTELDVVLEQNRPQPAPQSLRTLSCKHALCLKDDSEDASASSPAQSAPAVRMTCSRTVCFGGGD